MKDTTFTYRNYTVVSKVKAEAAPHVVKAIEAFGFKVSYYPPEAEVFSPKVEILVEHVGPFSRRKLAKLMRAMEAF